MINVESLAMVVPGQDVEIVRVILRDRTGANAPAGLRPGRRLRCRYSGSFTLILVSPAGERISVRRDVARYIQVSRV